MTTIRNRVLKLEEQIGQNAHGRLITVRSNGATEQQMYRFLADEGIVVDKRKDQVVHLCTLFLDRQDHPLAVPSNMKLLYVHNMRKS